MDFYWCQPKLTVDSDNRSTKLRFVEPQRQKRAKSMSAFRSWSLCLLVLVCAVLPGHPTVKPVQASPQIAAGLPPEVRIRKLHLVRPDLIPYPIAYEVNC